MVTDDHDVYANDLWGRGGRRMTGNRTTGGYRMHPMWVNAAERTQMWRLPDAAAPGPWGDGIHAYFTSLDYGGVSFALVAKADGLQGYGMILFDKDQHRITLELNTFDANREPKQIAVPGWPKVIEVTSLLEIVRLLSVCVATLYLPSLRALWESRE